MYQRPKTDRAMSADDTFQITLLALAETSINIIRDRAGNNTKRLYWLDRMMKSLDGVDSTFEGTLPDNFINKSEKFMKFVESDMGILLRWYRGEEK